MTKHWQQIAEEARAARDKSIPDEYKIDITNCKDNVMHFATEKNALLTDRQVEITKLTATQLLKAIRERKYTCVETTQAFIIRAAIAHQLTNSLSEFFPEEGLEMARKLDEHYERTGELYGPLHGLPVSVKDHLHLKGHLWNIGFTAWANNRSTEEDEDGIIKSLRDAGCVFFMKTHMPTSGMVLETNSNLWGHVYNPYNRKVTSGGSSGGESVMISMYGTAMAVGTDAAGSIRCPAAFLGNYALKPTSARFSYTGQANTSPSQITIPGTAGPICRTLEDVKLLSKFLIDVEPWNNDPNVVPIPWRDVKAPEKLTVGVLRFDGTVMPHPPVLRAIDESVEKLKAAGHEVYEFGMPFDCDEVMEKAVNMYFQSGFAEGKALLAETNEPLIPALSQIFERYGIDRELKGSETFKLNAYRNKVRKQFLDHWLATANSTKSGRPIDALLLPISPGAAFEHDVLPYWGYTSVYNVLDLPGLVLPIKGCIADKNKDLKDPNYNPVSSWDKDTYDQYDPELFHGTPVSLQVVGRRYFEEELIAIGEAMDRDINQV
uniref:amidase n=1 Tax=Blastobotrys adeninivorans TaxID=409370 RepID=A0A060SXN6_BLAAD